MIEPEWISGPDLRRGRRLSDPDLFNVVAREGLQPYKNEVEPTPIEPPDVQQCRKLIREKETKLRALGATKSTTFYQDPNTGEWRRWGDCKCDNFDFFLKEELREVEAWRTKRADLKKIVNGLETHLEFCKNRGGGDINSWLGFDFTGLPEMLGMGKKDRISALKLLGSDTTVYRVDDVERLFSSKSNPNNSPEPQPNHNAPPLSIKTPPDTTWANLRMVLRNNDATEMIELNCHGGHIGNFDPWELGFRGRGKKGTGGKPWILFRSLAEGRGEVPTSQEKDEIKPTAARLRKLLCAMFPGIEGDPLPWCKKLTMNAKPGWRAAFMLTASHYEDSPPPIAPSSDDALSVYKDAVKGHENMADRYADVVERYTED